MNRLVRVLWLTLSLAVSGCAATGDPRASLTTDLIAAPQPATRLVIVLPGRSDDLDALRRSGVAAAIQQVWPDADVQLVALTLPYYRAGVAPQRLHDDVVTPARQRGYRAIWLAGASMGGAGALLYDASHAQSVDGLVLLAPYLGDTSLHEAIRAAGGLARWSAGPPQPITAETWQHEIWRRLQATRDPGAARRIWLGYGDRDRLRTAYPLLTPLLPEQQIVIRSGGHAWSVWTPVLADVLARIDAAQTPAGTSR